MFKKHYKLSSLSVQVVKHPGSPSQVVRHAAKRRASSSGDYDQTWCVVDVDEYRDLEHATALAREENVELVVSNPCFEVWLLLHHTDHRKWVRNYDAVKSLLLRHVPVPDDKSVNFERDYHHDEDGNPRWRQAVTRARRLAEEGREHLENPSTGMWRLALAIHGCAD
ncbi:RloB-like protein [Streptomyces aidingensis]|uniref:RloB-like protein n=2 Tax=Streptomyces aidingensis TaxID=910347 RepID=A0A1I1R2Q2_9ACTN|nr:RloB-like protein [Streptomyces aidingensis]